MWNIPRSLSLFEEMSKDMIEWFCWRMFATSMAPSSPSELFGKLITLKLECDNIIFDMTLMDWGPIPHPSNWRVLYLISLSWCFWYRRKLFSVNSQLESWDFAMNICRSSWLEIGLSIKFASSNFSILCKQRANPMLKIKRSFHMRVYF